MVSKRSKSIATGTRVVVSEPFQFHGLGFRVAITIIYKDGAIDFSYAYETDWNQRSNKSADTFVSRGRVVSSAIAEVRLPEAANGLAMLISEYVDTAQIGFVRNLSSLLAKTERIVACELIRALPTKDLKSKFRILNAR